MKNKRDVFVLTRNPFAAVSLANIVLAVLIYSDQQSAWIKKFGIEGVSGELLIEDALTLVQFYLAAFTLDQLVRRLFVSFNRAVKQNVIPVFSIQLASVLIYALTSLACYLFIFDHPLDSLLAASGMVSLALGYLSKDLIQDVLISIQIQSGGLVSVNDWVQLSKMGEGQIYQIVDFDYCMVTLRNVNGYQQMVRNRFFYENRILNLSRQDAGSKRSAEIDVDAQFSEQVVLEVLNQVVPYLCAKHSSVFPKYFCRIQEVSPYRMTFMIDYACAPFVNPTESDHWVKQASARFLRCAGMIDMAGEDRRSEPAHDGERTDLVASGNQQFLTRLTGASQYCFLKVLSLDELQTLSSLVRVVQFRQGMQLLNSGEAGNSMYLVSEGSLRVEPKIGQATEGNVVYLWPGDCVGEMTVLTGAERTADVYATTDVRLIEIASEHLSVLIARNTALADALAELITQRQNLNSEFPTQVVSEPESRKTLRDKILAFLGRKVFK